MKNREKGILGENLAISFLKKKNYEILKRNYHSAFGEIDIIVKKNDLIAFIEVKLRTNNYYGNILEQVSSTKKKRIIKTAEFFLNDYTGFYQLCRFDYIMVIFNQNQVVNIHHMINAFDVEYNF